MTWYYLQGRSVLTLALQLKRAEWVLELLKALAAQVVWYRVDGAMSMSSLSTHRIMSVWMGVRPLVMPSYRNQISGQLWYALPVISQ